ncbi:hypothetical protein PO909_014490 [Leuciscus waleckii]
MRCFGCGKSGHLIRGCPENSAHHSGQNDGEKGNAEQNEDGEVASTSNAPNSSGPKIVSVEIFFESELTRQSVEIDERNAKKNEIVTRESVESNSIDGGEALARKNQEENKVDNESSESDCSDSSGSVCSQTSWSCLEYGVDERKKFLKVTKNMRGVKIDEYFPDLRRLLENIKCLMSEGRFADKEVYRLKKIVTKIQLQLNNDDEMV